MHNFFSVTLCFCEFFMRMRSFKPNILVIISNLILVSRTWVLYVWNICRSERKYCWVNVNIVVTNNQFNTRRRLQYNGILTVCNKYLNWIVYEFCTCAELKQRFLRIFSALIFCILLFMRDNFFSGLCFCVRVLYAHAQFYTHAYMFSTTVYEQLVLFKPMFLRMCSSDGLFG